MIHVVIETVNNQKLARIITSDEYGRMIDVSSGLERSSASAVTSLMEKVGKTNPELVGQRFKLTDGSLEGTIPAPRTRARKARAAVRQANWL